VARGWRYEAKRYGAPLAFLLAVTVAVLLVRSGLRSDPELTTTTLRTTVGRTTSTPTGTRKGPARRFYRLRSGETLSDVAIKFNTTVEELEVLNPGIRPTNLTVGQRLRVQ